MAGVPGRSGGWNRVSLQVHKDRGTFRRDRHQHLVDAARGVKGPAPVSVGLRRVAVRGLNGHALTIVQQTLNQYGDWTRPAIETLRAYALSAERLAALSLPGGDAAERRREMRNYLDLLKALDLERP